MPEGCLHVWASFLELHAGRGSNGFGPEPLRYTEIEAWTRLTGRCLAPLEVEWIKAIDAAWLSPAEKGAK